MGLGFLLSLQIYAKITLGLALNAYIRVRNRPHELTGIVLELTPFYRRMIALTAVMEQDAVATIFGYSKADSIHRPVRGNLSALAGITEVAEVS